MLPSDSTFSSSRASSSKKSCPAVYLRYTDQTEDLPPILPDNVFFTADTHFFCDKALSHRPQFKDMREMNETLIRNWNETVPEDGVVFHLGDLATHLHRDVITGLVRRLNGTILLVKGNHDDISILRGVRFREDTGLQVLGYMWSFWLEGIKILLSHYPFLCYEGEYHGVWQLFGHVHSGSGFDIPRLQYMEICTQPTQAAAAIYDKLGLRHYLFRKIKIVVLKPDPANANALKTEEMRQVKWKVGLDSETGFRSQYQRSTAVIEPSCQ